MRQAEWYTKFLSAGIALCFFVLPMAWFISRKSVGYVGIALAVFILLAVISNKVDWRRLGKTPLKYIFWVFLLYFIWRVISFLVHQDQAKMLDNPSRAVIGLMLLAVILRLKPRLSALIYGIPLGAIVAGCIAFYQRFYLHRRPFTELMVIEAGNIAISLGLLSLCMVFYCVQKRMKWGVMFACAGLLGGVGASLLSEVRGGWVLAPVLIVYVFYVYRHSFDKKYIISFFTVLLAVAIGVISTTHVPVMNRLESVVQNIEQYQSGNEETSVGLRFALWKSAVISIQEKPFIGWTKDGLQLSKQQQVEVGLAPPAILAFDHVHNQFLDDWAKYGLIGLVLLLAVFFTPIMVLRKMRHLSHETQLLYTCLVVHVVAVMGFGLTQAFLNHNNGNIFYFLMVSIFMGYFVVQSQQTENKHETDYS